MSPGDFLNSFFPAVECKLPFRDLTFGQNKIIVIVHNSNDPRNCLVYSVISSQDTNIDITLLKTRTIAICEGIRNCLRTQLSSLVTRSNAINVRMFAAPLPDSCGQTMMPRPGPGLSTFSWPLTSWGSSPAPLFSVTTSCKHQSLNSQDEPWYWWCPVRHHCYHLSLVSCLWPGLGVGDHLWVWHCSVTLGRAKTPLVAAAAPHWEHNWLWPSRDLSNKTPESRGCDLLRSWETTGEKILWGTRKNLDVLKKVLMSYSWCLPLLGYLYAGQTGSALANGGSISHKKSRPDTI